MSDTPREPGELSKQERYLRWREHMRSQDNPVSASAEPRPDAGSPSFTTEWTPESLFESSGTP